MRTQFTTVTASFGLVSLLVLLAGWSRTRSPCTVWAFSTATAVVTRTRSMRSPGGGSMDGCAYDMLHHPMNDIFFSHSLSSSCARRRTSSPFSPAAVTSWPLYQSDTTTAAATTTTTTRTASVRSKVSAAAAAAAAASRRRRYSSTGTTSSSSSSSLLRPAAGVVVPVAEATATAVGNAVVAPILTAAATARDALEDTWAVTASQIEGFAAAVCDSIEQWNVGPSVAVTTDKLRSLLARYWWCLPAAVLCSVPAISLTVCRRHAATPECWKLVSMDYIASCPNAAAIVAAFLLSNISYFVSGLYLLAKYSSVFGSGVTRTATSGISEPSAENDDKTSASSVLDGGSSGPNRLAACLAPLLLFWKIGSSGSDSRGGGSGTGAVSKYCSRQESALGWWTLAAGTVSSVFHTVQAVGDYSVAESVCYLDHGVACSGILYFWKVRGAPRLPGAVLSAAGLAALCVTAQDAYPWTHSAWHALSAAAAVAWGTQEPRRGSGSYNDSRSSSTSTATSAAAAVAVVADDCAMMRQQQQQQQQQQRQQQQQQLEYRQGVNIKSNLDSTRNRLACLS